MRNGPRIGFQDANGKFKRKYDEINGLIKENKDRRVKEGRTNVESYGHETYQGQKLPSTWKDRQQQSCFAESR